MPAPKGPRPITQALNIVKRGTYPFTGVTRLSRRSALRLTALLVAMDASTGKPDAARKRRAKKRK